MSEQQLDSAQASADEIRTHDPVTVANWFVNRMVPDGAQLYTTSLLKLIYISHGWHLEIFNGIPLVNKRFYAWKYGPVVEGVYDAFAKKERPIKNPAPPVPDDPEIGSRQARMLEQIVDVYGDMNARQLTSLTHEVGGPWDLVVRNFGPYRLIPNALILSHYKKVRKDANEEEALNND